MGNEQEVYDEHQARSSTPTLDGEEVIDEIIRVKSTLEIPNGGLVAWLQVLSGFFTFFCSWGIVNAFGIFQSYYSSHLDVSEADVAWIGSINSFLLCFSTVFYGPIFDRGHGRALLLYGTFMEVFGMMMTSLSTKYYQIVLAQGVCMGLGSGAIFLAGVATVPAYFSSKRALAIGICAAGSSIGGVIWPIVVHKLQPQIGFPWTARVFGFIALALLSIPIAFLRPRSRPPKKLFDVSTFSEMPFNVFNVGCFLGFVGQYIPFFYMQQYASAVGVGGFSFYLISIINVGSVFGRIIPAFLADCFGAINVMSICTLVAGMVAFFWIPAKSEGALIIISLLYGFFSGAFVSLQPSAIAGMTKDIKVIGARFGLNTMFAAFGLLIGNPVGGIIVKSSWTGLQSLCGAAMVVSAVVVFATRVMVAGPSVRAKM
ncbi:putative mfs monocarboxylate [Phaeomoniella chlamydospora]|uniref:Putative mfs monocarboxylate n=1 Tax=Phaeomoniella chlamydospora TaxID=158046 RepID=A0A0G2F4U7_PHACM|nr:putative mfs monocarboxylate [Phaeomoniella chlamydospora]